MRGIKFLGTGEFYPEKVITNDQLSEIIETSNEWIESRTGIRERHISDIPNHEMAARAAASAIADSGVSPEEIDLVIACTCSPEFFYPSMACLVQQEVGAVNAAAYDLNAACTGFICAVDIASRYLEDGDYRNILIVASELLSKHLDFEDRGSCVLFGDGAAAAVLTHSEKPFYSYLSAKGDPFQNLYCHINLKPNCPYHSGDPYAELLPDEKKRNYLQMDGKGVYKFAVDAMAVAMTRVLEKAGLTADDLDLVIPHQANARIIQAAMKQMKLPEEKVFVNIYTHANVSSVCIPSCLDELKKAGRLRDGMRVCLVGFGAGLTSGAIIYEM